MMNNFHKSIIYSVFGSLAAVGLLVSVTACKDDFDYRNNVGQPIAFTLSAPDAWHDGMSVNENAPTTRCTSVKALSGGETKLYLHTVVADNPAEEKGAVTRGTPVTSDLFKGTYKTFSLSGICYTGVYPEEESENKWTANYAYNLHYKTADGEAVKSENSLLWPSNGNVRFFAFAPTLDKYKELVGNDGSLTLSDVSHEGSPTLIYTVPTDVTKQIDLMTAQANATGPTTPKVELKFGHALTAVQIKCGKDMLAGKITEVSISGVYGSGTHVIGSDKWTPSGDPSAVYTISKEIDLPSKEGSDDIYHAAEDTQITGKEGDNLTFMLLPQTLPDGAKITITFTDSATDTERTLSGSIAGQKWEAGKIVTCTLSQSSINITPKIEFSKKPATADNPTGDVMPYSGVWYDVDYKPAKVEIVQAEDTQQIATIPIDQIQFKYRLDGSEDWVDCTTNADGLLTIAPQPAYSTMSSAFTEDVVGSEGSPSDLSKEYGETANCYLVDKAGYYSLPLVYGNGNLQGGHENGIKWYVNHNDEKIISSDIPDVSDAVLVWQDAPDLIDPESVGLDDKKKNLVFKIRKQTLTQGNALLAVRDGSSPKKILWSWHIWVTPYKEKFYSDFYNSKTDYGPADGYSFAQYNLGWCDSHVHNVSREFKLCAIVDMSAYGGDQKTSIDIGTFTQMEFKGSNAGDNTYYQWGRKDPMLGGIYSANTPTYKYYKYNKYYPNDPTKWTADFAEFTMENKQVFNQYNKDGYDYSFCKNPGDAVDTTSPLIEPSIGVTIGYSIQHPYMFVTNSRYVEVDKCDFDYRNHWHVPYRQKNVDYLDSQTHILYNAWNANPDVGDAGLAYDGKTATDQRNAWKVVKSMYDPCPPGFLVPPIDAFRGIANLKGTTQYPNYYGKGTTTYDSTKHSWTMVDDSGKSITFPKTGVRDYALRTNEWQSVELNTGSDPDFNVTDFYKTSYPAFSCLTFVSSATIIDKGDVNAFQLLIFAIDKRGEPDSAHPKMSSCFGPSSNAYGLPVRPIKKY